MPSESRHRSRSVSPDSSRRSKRRRDDSGSDDDAGPPPGVATLDVDDDFFLKSTELKLWLHEEKRKKFDQLSGSDARRYFRKFVKAWNRGRLPQKYYDGISAASLASSVSSGYTWNFSKATQRELDDAGSIRKQVDSTGRNKTGPTAAMSSGGGKVVLGPAMPPGMGGSALEALQHSRDEADRLFKQDKASRKDAYRRENREARDEARDDRATGRDRLVEKRREANEDRRQARDAREGGGMLDFDDDTLLGASGGSDSFKKAIADRDRYKNNPKRVAREEEKRAVMSDKMQQFKTKEQQTMDSLRALAAARYG